MLFPKIYIIWYVVHPSFSFIFSPFLAAFYISPSFNHHPPLLVCHFFTSPGLFVHFSLLHFPPSLSSFQICSTLLRVTGAKMTARKRSRNCAQRELGKGSSGWGGLKGGGGRGVWETDASIHTRRQFSNGIINGWKNIARRCWTN